MLKKYFIRCGLTQQQAWIWKNHGRTETHARGVVALLFDTPTTSESGSYGGIYGSPLPTEAAVLTNHGYHTEKMSQKSKKAKAFWGTTWQDLCMVGQLLKRGNVGGRMERELQDVSIGFLQVV